MSFRAAAFAGAFAVSLGLWTAAFTAFMQFRRYAMVYPQGAITALAMIAGVLLLTGGAVIRHPMRRYVLGAAAACFFVGTGAMLVGAP